MKAMIDYHVHSDVSGDCETDMLEMAAAASKIGIKDMCFTEHLDPDFPGGWDFSLDSDRFEAQIKKARAAFPQIRIAKGLEAGLGKETAAQVLEYVSKHEFDYVIGSQHLVYGMDPFEDPVWGEYEQEQLYEQYLRETIENVSGRLFFDALGHLGYLAKAPQSGGRVLRYTDHRELIDTVLKILIQNGKGIEVNTSGIPRSGSPMPEAEIIKRYFELGGSVITVGSDAHREASVGRHIPETLELIKSAGFKYVCAFEKRKPKFLKI